jgi:DNA-binding transcriptional LysR family regulator
MVKSLESDLNCQLFTRNESGIELTPKGELLYRDAMRMANMLELTEEKISGGYNKQVKNHLKLVCPIGISTIYISHVIDSFVNSYPDIYLEVISYDDMSLNEKLSGHILIHPFIEELNGYKKELLINMELRLFASREYLKNYGTPMNVDDLNNHRLIAFSRGKKIFVDLNWHLKIGMSDGEERIPVFEADANFGRCYLAYKGVGIITVPKIHPDVKKYDLVQVLSGIEGPKYNYYLIVDEVLCDNVIIRTFMNALKKNFSEL